MKLETIKISNYRCFEELSVNFQDDVTLFVGINGSGKSSILDAIAIALYDVVEMIVKSPSDELRANNRTYANENDFHISASGNEFPNGTRSQAQRDKSIKIETTVRTNYSPIEALRPDDNDDINLLAWTDIIKHEQLSNITYTQAPGNDVWNYMDRIWMDFDEVPLPMVAYYRGDRKFVASAPVTEVPTHWYDWITAFENCLAAGTDFSAAASWLFLSQFDEQERRSGPSSLGTPTSLIDYHDPILMQVREAIKRAFPNIEAIGFSGRPPTLKVLMQNGDGLRELNISQLSDGYRVLLGIIVDFARRLATANPISKDPLSEAGILLIDEIELHLHPGWQQTVIPRLRDAFPGTQIIATTHSPQVLTSVEGRCIRILRDGNLFAAPQSTSGAESKRVLEDVFGVSSRPPKDVSPFVADLDNLYGLIDSDKLDEARAMVEQLKERAYDDDPAVIEAEVMVENRLWEKGTVG